MARRYGQIESAFWTHPDTRKLSDAAKLLAAYLLTGPHTNLIGCYRLPVQYVSADLGWDGTTVTQTVSELFGNGFGTHDSEWEYVLIGNFLRWNSIDNPNQGKAAMQLVAQIPVRSMILPLMIHELEQFCRHISAQDLERLRNGCGTVAERLPKPFRNQEQEQEPSSLSFRRLKDRGLPLSGNSHPGPGPEPAGVHNPASSSNGTRPPFSPHDLATGFNECVAGPYGLPAVSLPLSPGRQTKARVRIREHPEVEFWNSVFESYADSRFLRGESGREGWRGGTFDFLVRNTEASQKILEGAYRDQPISRR